MAVGGRRGTARRSILEAGFEREDYLETVSSYFPWH